MVLIVLAVFGAMLVGAGVLFFLARYLSLD